MNIFYLDQDIIECAKFHCDKHVVKMPTEHIQMLSTAHRVLDGHEVTIMSTSGRKTKGYRLSDQYDNEVFYKATHVNHPSAIWARSNRSCYEYLYMLTVALCEEHTHRYGTIRSCIVSGLLDRLATPPKNIRRGDFTEPPPAMPEAYIVAGDSVTSYRTYYSNDKQHIAQWKHRAVPHWFK